MQTVAERIAALRAAMCAAGCSAYLIPNCDPHASEYLPAHYRAREYFSGFSCENSNLAVTEQGAALWVDGRFFGAADAALAGTGIDCLHMGVKGVPTVEEYLRAALTRGGKLGYEPATMPVRQKRELEKALASTGTVLCPLHLENELWQAGRPALPATGAWLLEKASAGRTAAEKLAVLRGRLAEQGCTAELVTRLESVAWLLNLRAADVEDTPFALAFCFVTEKDAVLFIDGSRVPEAVRGTLAADGVVLRRYEDVEKTLAGWAARETVLADTGALTDALYSVLAGNPAFAVREGADPILLLKAVKNETELACTRQAHLADGAAMVRFQMELERRLAAGETLRETDIDPILHRFRSANEGFWGESFGTIAAYGPNAAMMHYAPKPGADAEIARRGFLLVDSGATYRTGTTDITRTYAVGPLTEAQKTDYTLVLQCHIALAMAVWKAGANGGELDMLARQPLWSRLLDYRSGTGHSVAHVGAVHEGPHSLRPHNAVEFVPGMVITDEPGLYEEGDVGIRVENELECVEAGESEYGRFLRFAPLTWVPIDLTPVLPALLTQPQRDWLNAYHAGVLARLSPLLNAEETAWLAGKCAPLR